MEEYQKSHTTKKDNSSFGLNLKGKSVYAIYQILATYYINPSQTSLHQLCYALTGKLRPSSISKIEWIATADDFAIFLNCLFPKRKRYKPIEEIFIFYSEDFSVKHLRSRCHRLSLQNAANPLKTQLAEILKEE